MPTAQIPLWVTYSLAAIAILGPVGGAFVGGWITSRRDDKRWNRERQLHDERWHRDYQNERHLKIYEERRSAYVDSLSAVYSWNTFLLVWQEDLSVDPNTPSRMGEANELTRRTLNTMAAVELVGGASVRSALQNLIEVIGEFQMMMGAASLSGRAPNEDDIEQALNKGGVAYRKLQDAARKDIASLLAINPSLPSGSAS